MPDRVRESVFNILGSACGTPGELPPLIVADLFAGSGSIGLEALSRGAAFCLFVEHDSEAADTLRRNLHELGVGPEGSLLVADAWESPLSVFADKDVGSSRTADRASRGGRWPRMRRGELPHSKTPSHGSDSHATWSDGLESFVTRRRRTSGSPHDAPRAYDLFFLDPPYASARDTMPSGPVPRLLERLAAFAAPRARVVLHHERAIVYPDRHWAGWSVDDRRAYGTHAVTFYSR